MTGLLESKEYEHTAAVLQDVRGKLAGNPTLAPVVDHFDLW
jgi:hypothetical protein